MALAGDNQNRPHYSWTKVSNHLGLKDNRKWIKGNTKEIFGKELRNRRKVFDDHPRLPQMVFKCWQIEGFLGVAGWALQVGGAAIYPFPPKAASRLQLKEPA